MNLKLLQRKSTHTGATVLVMAPYFPAINQPWIDTYLEGLQAQGMAFKVFSWNRRPTKYHEKVNQLDLRSQIVLAPTGRLHPLTKGVKAIAQSPSISWTVAVASFRNNGEKSVLRRVNRSIHALAALAALQRYPDAAVIHSHSEFMSSAFLEAAQALAIPLVMTFHGLPPLGVKPISSARRSQIAAYATSVLVNTQFARAKAVKIGYHDITMRVVPQGLPLDDFPPRNHDKKRNGTVHVLSVGRMHRDKGHAYALIALARLARAGVDIRWRFIGSGPDRERLERLAERLGISSLISFEQNLALSEMVACYQSSHLFVLASIPNQNPYRHVETQGVVLQEAQASGCIPIATRVGGIPECINHGEDGWLVKPRSHRAIALAITELVSRRDAWPEIRKLGRQNVETRFSAHSVAEQVAEILEHAARQPLGKR